MPLFIVFCQLFQFCLDATSSGKFSLNNEVRAKCSFQYVLLVPVLSCPIIYIIYFFPINSEEGILKTIVYSILAKTVEYTIQSHS